MERKANGLHVLQSAELQSLADAYVSATRGGGAPKPVPARNIQAALYPRHHGVMRPLKRLVGAPQLSRDEKGHVSLHCSHGYDFANRAWHEYPSPTAPGTHRDYRWLFDLVLGEYLFAAPLDRWVAEAAMLTPLFRPLVLWAPAFLIWAVAAGAGKTILAQFLGRIQLGYSPHVEPIGMKAFELDYALAAAFQYSGPTGVVLLDNLVAHENFDSPALAAILTARSQARTPRLPKQTSGFWVDPSVVTVLATGISPYLGPELRRRFLPIQLGTSASGSWSRTPDQIERELDQYRPRVIAALTWAAGHILQPSFRLHQVEIPSFVEWGQMAGGLLMSLYPDEADEIEAAWATIPDLLLRRRADETDVALLGLLLSVPEDTPGIHPFLLPGQLLARLDVEPACESFREILEVHLAGRTQRAKQTWLGNRLHALVAESVVSARVGAEERPHRKGGNVYRAVFVTDSAGGRTR